MARQVIDELIFTLGLDASTFTRGQKEAAASMLNTQKAVTSSVASIGSAVANAAGKVAGFVLGFKGLEGVISLVKETASQFKQLGITAELLGTSVRNVRVAQEFSQLAGAGGSALSDFVQGGRMALSQLTLGGMPKWALPALIGLDPRSAFLGSPEDVFKRWQSAANTHAGQLQRMMPGASTPQMAVQQFMQMAGMDPALAAEATNRKHAADDLLRAQRTNANVTKQMAESGRSATNALIDLKTQVENAATLGFGPLTAATEALNQAFGELMKIVQSIVDFWHGATGNKIVNTGLSIGSGVEDYAKWLYGGAGKGFAALTNLLHGNFMSDVFDSQNMLAPSIIRNPSLDAIRMPNPDALLHAMPAINFGPAKTAALLGPGGQGGTSNSMAIGSVNISTQATDAAGIAASMRQALARKFNVTQADSGVVA